MQQFTLLAAEAQAMPLIWWDTQRFQALRPANRHACAALTA